jgi:O-succinylbenzoic acid--CoA ligase
MPTARSPLEPFPPTACAPSLADHFAAAARTRPQEIALSYRPPSSGESPGEASSSQASGKRADEASQVGGERAWSWSAWHDEITRCARQLPAGVHAVVATGPALDLVRLAAACSQQNRPFWPVDRATAWPAGAIPPAGTQLLIATSGSSGRPKVVCLGNAQLDHAADAANQRLDLRAGDCWLHCLPLYHIGGQAILWRCARAAASLRLHEGFALNALADDLARRSITHLSLVPTMLARLIDAGVPPPASLRVALIGGAALSQALHDRARAAGWPLVPSYGMSESAAMIAAWQASDGPWRAGQVGRLLPGNQVSLSPDGRIRLAGQQMMLGYLDDGVGDNEGTDTDKDKRERGNDGAPEHGDTRYGQGYDSDGRYTTGDHGEIAADGQLTVIGRADDVLISGGVNVQPQQVESCLAALPGVRDVAVGGRADAEWGERVVALVVGEVSLQQIRDHVARLLPPAAWPRECHCLPQLPRNATGKLDRPAIRRLIAELGLASAPHHASQAASQAASHPALPPAPSPSGPLGLTPGALQQQ